MANNFQQYKERGNSFFQRKQFDQAIEWYSKALAEDPNVHAVYTNRAAAYFNTNQIEASLADAERSLELEPAWTKGYYRKGMCLLKLNKPREAVNAFTEGLKVEPGNAQVKDGLAEAKAVLATIPADHNEAKARGNECYKVSQYEEAVKWYSQALDIAPPEEADFKATVLTNRAECYRQMAQDDLTIRDCTAALAITPDNVKALLRRGLAYERIDKLKLGLEDLKRATSLAPGTQMASEGVLRISKALRQQEKCG